MLTIGCPNCAKSIVAAYDAYNVLDGDVQKYVTNYATLVADIKAVEKLEAYDVAAKVKALPTVDKVVVADKEAVKTTYDAYTAYNTTEMYKAPIVANKTYGGNYDFVKALDNIKKAEKKAVTDAVEALDNKYKANLLTIADKEAVEAAQAALAAYTAEYADTTMEDTEKTLNVIAKAMANLVKLDEEANKYTDADAKAFVQDTVVKASSTVKNGKVTVTANADVQELLDNGYTVEFKFYKSTKKSSGYKATVTKNAAESKTYTNTKPAKGANYYKYIIIVTDAEGNVVTKTALKECAYAKRTIK